MTASLIIKGGVPAWSQSPPLGPLLLVLQSLICSLDLTFGLFLVWGVGVWEAPILFNSTCLESWGNSLFLMLPASSASATSIVQYVWQPAMVTWPGQFRTQSVLSIWKDNMSRVTQVLPTLTLSSSLRAGVESTEEGARWRLSRKTVLTVG